MQLAHAASSFVPCSAQVVGPFVYGVTFSKTVGTFPKALFLCACGALTLAFVLISFVRLPDADHLAAGDVEEQQPLVPAEDLDDAERSGPRREDTLVDVPTPLIIVEDADDGGNKVVKP